MLKGRNVGRCKVPSTRMGFCGVALGQTGIPGFPVSPLLSSSLHSVCTPASPLQLRSRHCPPPDQPSTTFPAAPATMGKEPKSEKKDRKKSRKSEAAASEPGTPAAAAAPAATVSAISVIAKPLADDKLAKKASGGRMPTGGAHAGFPRARAELGMPPCFADRRAHACGSVHRSPPARRRRRCRRLPDPPTAFVSVRQALKLAKKAAKRKQIKRGVKEVIKAIRKNVKG